MTSPFPADPTPDAVSPDIDYSLRRSEAEALRSLTVDDARAAAAHRELGLLHATRAIAGLAAAGDHPASQR